MFRSRGLLHLIYDGGSLYKNDVKITTRFGLSSTQYFHESTSTYKHVVMPVAACISCDRGALRTHFTTVCHGVGSFMTDPRSRLPCKMQSFGRLALSYTSEREGRIKQRVQDGQSSLITRREP